MLVEQGRHVMRSMGHCLPPRDRLKDEKHRRPLRGTSRFYEGIMAKNLETMILGFTP